MARRGRDSSCSAYITTGVRISPGKQEAKAIRLATLVPPHLPVTVEPSADEGREVAAPAGETVSGTDSSSVPCRSSWEVQTISIDRRTSSLVLRGELKDHKIRSTVTAPGDPVFVNLAGRRETVNNLGRRLKTVLRRADLKLQEVGLEAVDPAVTPYSFRRLYASLRYPMGDDPVYVAGQMGHADCGGLSMSVYATALRRRDRLSGKTLQEFDRALNWAEMGRVEPEPAAPGQPAQGAVA